MAIMATMKAITLPMIKNLIILTKIGGIEIAVLFKVPTNFARSLPNIVGTARKNENSAAAVRFSFCDIPPTIDAAERDTPGIMARHWNTPTLSAVRWLIFFLVFNNRAVEPVIHK